MKKRIGNDFSVYWILKENDVTLDVSTVVDFRIKIVHDFSLSEHAPDFEIVNGSALVKCEKEQLTKMGSYSLIATWRVEDASFVGGYRDCAADVSKFEIVARTAQEDDDNTVTSEVAIGFKGKQGFSAYEVWLEAGNVGTVEDYIAAIKGEQGADFTYEDFTPEQISNLQQPAIDAAEIATQAAEAATTAQGNANAAAEAANTAAGAVATVIDAAEQVIDEAEQATVNANNSAVQLVDGAETNYNTLKKLQDKLKTVEAIIGEAADDDALVDTVRELLAVFSSFPEGADIATMLTAKVNISDIYNALDCIIAGKALDARQGKILADVIASKEPAIAKSTGVLSWTGTAWAWLTDVVRTSVANTFTAVQSFTAGLKADIIIPRDDFIGVAVRNAANSSDVFKVDTFNNKVDFPKARFTQNHNKTTQPELYLNNGNLFFKDRQINTYVERTIPNVSSAVVDYGKCYEIGTFGFNSLQGVFKVDVILDGGACGQSSTTFLNTTYALDYLSFYKTTITQRDNIWINLQSIIESPRHAFNNTNAWIIQAKIVGNSISFRLKINEGNGYQAFGATARIKIYHSDDFTNGSYTEQTGITVDNTAYQTIPSILSSISGVSLIQNNLELVGYLELNGWIYLNKNVHTGDMVGDRRYKVVNNVIQTQACSVSNTTRGGGTWVTVGVQLSDNMATASEFFEGCKRYRKDSNNSYEETCMQTGASTYAWVIVKQITW